ncbi:TIR domain-containing protein [Adlercreutzia shanghongiae]|uniref:TIR domain-containing protein n=1 Tax=Adlercreutzia shanghongiae TaxID=3111773 RepID=A0ABU6J1Q9_9ACTN|nr:TIR domain-containing protein [Adlercreutzia sp. R22]MEC4295659.1 TIR domain-containing protein [Adlercreutzia sp. R22]
MDQASIKRNLEKANIKVIDCSRTGNDDGFRLELDNGAIVNCYDTGRHSVQGKNQTLVKSLLGDSVAKEPFDSESGKKVFVVYGRDLSARDELEAMLRRWGFDPLILEQQGSRGRTLIEKLETATTDVNFGIVLATPDDCGYQAGCEGDVKYRARQNVVLELGMLIAKLGRSRVAILLKRPAPDGRDMEKPSDIDGLLYLPFENRVDEVKTQLLKELVDAGFSVNVRHL